jgi:prefoldin subunit 5
MEMALDKAAELIDELPKDLSETRQQWRDEMMEYSESLMELRRKINNNTNVQGPDDIKQ